MAGSLLSDYGISDVNFDNMMLTLDGTYKGDHDLTITEFDTTTVPEIAAGSRIEINGGLYKFDSDEAISTTDPVTTAAVADGVVYIITQVSGSSVTAAFTATAPTWSDSKQGYYGTGAQANNRYCQFAMRKATTSYYQKYEIKGGNLANINFENSAVNNYLGGWIVGTDATERTTGSANVVTDSNLSVTINATAGDILNVHLALETKNSDGTSDIAFGLIDNNGNASEYLITADVMYSTAAYVGYMWRKLGLTSYYPTAISGLFIVNTTGQIDIRMLWSSIASTTYVQNRTMIVQRICNGGI